MYKTVGAPALIALFLLVTATHARADIILTIDDLPNLPSVNSFTGLQSANGGSLVYGNAVWDSRFTVVGDEYVEAFHNQGGTNPWMQPHSGQYAMFNSDGDDGLTIQTTDVITGAWFSRPDMGIGPRGTNQVTLNAMSGSTVIGFETIDLVDTTPVFLDTTSFLTLSGIDGYRIDRPAIGGDAYNGGHYVIDDIRISAVPEPSSFFTLAATGLIALTHRRKRSAAGKGEPSDEPKSRNRRI